MRVLLDESVTAADVDSLAWDDDWSIVRMIRGDATTPREVVYRREADAGNVLIHHIEDFVLDLAYLVLRPEGGNADIVDTYETITAALATHPAGRVVELAHRADSVDDWVRVTRYAAVVVTPEAPDLVAIVDRSLSHASAQVRRAGILAAAYGDLTGLVPQIRRLSTDDPDMAVREDAARLLDGFDTTSRPERTS